MSWGLVLLEEKMFTQTPQSDVIMSADIKTVFEEQIWSSVGFRVIGVFMQDLFVGLHINYNASLNFCIN